MDWQFILLSGLLTLFLILIHLHKARKNNKGTKCPPEPPRAWPVLGHLPLLAKHAAAPFCRTISAMSEQYGPIFGLRIGVQRFVFVSSLEAAKECFTFNDKALAARPSTAFAKYGAHNNAWFALAHGPYWREVRKITMVELLSVAKLTELKQHQLSEVDEFIKELYHSSINSNKIEISEWFRRFAVNIISKLTARKRYSCSGDDDDSSKAHRAIKNLLYAFGLFVISDAVPCSLLEWLDPQGSIGVMKRLSKEFDEVVDGWIREHREKALPHHQRGGEQDFIDVLLREVGKDRLKFDDYANDIIIKSTIQTILVGAIDTTSLTLTWVLSLLLNHREVMKHAKEEIDRVVGRERWVDESDIDSLVYINAIIKETMRLYPALPLSVPHVASEDCCIGGYRIKRGVRVMINFWKVHRDPRIWENPEEFRSERFLGKELEEVGVRSGSDYRYIPFGSGRRFCPGNDLAKMVMPLTVARLLQSFDVSTFSDEPVDMTEGLGVTIPKATPLEVMVTPRLSSSMYQ